MQLFYTLTTHTSLDGGWEEALCSLVLAFSKLLSCWHQVDFCVLDPCWRLKLASDPETLMYEFKGEIFPLMWFYETRCHFWIQEKRDQSYFTVFHLPRPKVPKLLWSPLWSFQVGNQLSVSHKSRSKPGLKSLCVKSGFIFVDVADQKLRITNQLQPNSNWSHINVDGLITPEHIN